jgi:hypothetical protein
MVVQLLILPVGFGRFFPRWQRGRKRTFIAEPTWGTTRGVGSRRGTRHTSTVNPSCVNFSETENHSDKNSERAIFIDKERA